MALRTSRFRLLAHVKPSSRLFFQLRSHDVSLRSAHTWHGIFRDAIGPRTLVAHFQTRPKWPGHVAFMLSGVSFLLSDILWLRTFAACSCVLTIIFNYYHPIGRPIYLPIQWNMFYVCVNLFYIIRMIQMRMARLNYFEHRIYTQFFQNEMSVYEFQQLIKLATFAEVDQREQLFSKGDHPNCLVLVFKGNPEVEVESGVLISVKPGLLGEISYLTGEAATASVYLLPGVEYIKWQRKDLENLRTTDPAAFRGLEHTMTRELAGKISNMNSKFKSNAPEPPSDSATIATQLSRTLSDKNSDFVFRTGSQKPDTEYLARFACDASASIHHALLRAGLGESETLDDLVDDLEHLIAGVKSSKSAEQRSCTHSEDSHVPLQEKTLSDKTPLRVKPGREPLRRFSSFATT